MSPPFLVKMSGQELRRRLHKVDPDLKIVSGRRRITKSTTRMEKAMQLFPRVLSPDEVKVWGLPEMIPIFPTEEVLAIESKWSKEDLQKIAVDYFLSPEGDKDLLVRKLVYVGALDKDGELTGLPVGELAQQVPYVISAPRKFCCKLCNACAPENLLKRGRFLERISWLREHYKAQHPGIWGRSVPSVSEEVKPEPERIPETGYKFPLGQTVMTRGVADKVATDPAFAAFILESLKRHASGDWGDLCEDDKKENEYALGKYLRLFSSYEKKGLPKIWIITEADRSVTTTLFPEEY